MLPGHASPPLTLPPDEMRRLGYQVIDLIVDALSGLRERPPSHRATPAELAGVLHEPVPAAGADPEEVLRQAVHDVLAPAMRVDHPRFFAYVPIPSNYVGVLADLLSSGFGIFAGTWQAASGAAAAELAVLGWLRHLFGLPGTAGGLFVDGGSSANLYGLTAARRAQLDDELAGAVAYTSDQAHSAVARAMCLLGFQPSQLRALPADGAYRLRPADVEAAVAADRAAGRRPFCVIATAGTTSTGSVDPLHDLAAVCRAEGLWLHVDGAFGAPAILTRAAPRPTSRRSWPTSTTSPRPREAGKGSSKAGQVAEFRWSRAGASGSWGATARASRRCSVSWPGSRTPPTARWRSPRPS